jgi:hypothetical protein
MTRVTRHLAALALAGTVASGSLFATTPALAGATGGNDGLVNVTNNNVVVQPNVPIAVAANVCGVSIAAVAIVDDSGTAKECTALGGAATGSWIKQN